MIDFVEYSKDDRRRQRERIKYIAECIGEIAAAKDNHYDSSWRRRGGVGAYFTIVRKWDRIEAYCEADEIDGESVHQYDLFERFELDERYESIVNDCVDLVGYLFVLLEHMAFLEQMNKSTDRITEKIEQLLEEAGVTSRRPYPTDSPPRPGPSESFVKWPRTEIEEKVFGESNPRPSVHGHVTGGRTEHPSPFGYDPKDDNDGT